MILIKNCSEESKYHHVYQTILRQTNCFYSEEVFIKVFASLVLFNPLLHMYLSCA